MSKNKQTEVISSTVPDSDRPSLLPKGALQITQQTPYEMLPASFDKKTPEGRARMFNAQNAPCDEPSEEKPVEICATDWAVVGSEAPDETTGEMRWYPCVVLFDAKGGMLKTSSGVVGHHLAAALRDFPQEDWDRGILFSLNARKSKKGRTYYYLHAEV
jgi:hypothetical protein